MWVLPSHLWGGEGVNKAMICHTVYDVYVYWVTCTIQGVPESDIWIFSQNLIDQIGLTEYADKPSGGYSGGNKTKLSVGVSVVHHHIHTY